MRVSLGTLEIDEDTRKKLGKKLHGSSYLKRDEARDWALGLIDTEIAKLTGATAPAVEPVTSPPDAGHLPEPAPPTAAGTAT
jgi:hypothetical protein